MCFFSLALLGYVSFLFFLLFLRYDNVYAGNNKPSSVCRACERNERKTYILDYYHHYTKDSYSHTYTTCCRHSFVVYLYHLLFVVSIFVLKKQVKLFLYLFCVFNGESMKFFRYKYRLITKKSSKHD